MPQPPIRIRGARQHNLRDLDVDIPRNRLTVVTGVSGSGKSSLAFHTLYAEGQRRYVETFSAYARQFLDRMDRPDVDAVEDIPPAIAIERKGPLRGGRSTVATLCELMDPLRVLWARAGSLSCAACKKPVRVESPATTVDALAGAVRGTKWILAFEVSLDRKAARAGTISDLAQAGFRRLWDGSRVVDVDARGDAWPRKGPALVVVDRVISGRTARARLLDSCETAFRAGRGTLVAIELPDARIRRFHSGRTCTACGRAHQRPTPALFSANSPVGACETCSGFGRTTGIDWDLVVPVPQESIRQGAIRPFQTPAHRRWRGRLLAWCKEEGIDIEAPWRTLPASSRKQILQGAGDWPGVVGHFKALERKRYKVHVRVHMSRYRGYPICEACQGGRLGPEGRAWQVFGQSLPAFLALPVVEARAQFEAATTREALAALPRETREVVKLLWEEIRARLVCLDDVGLGYLSLDRAGRTLSGGEVQRVHLTAAIGTHLVGTLFVLDEPSVGLHPRDTGRLVAQLRRLVAYGNTVVVVEHDGAVLAAADHVIDMGPRAGEYGGHVVAQGTLAQVRRHRTSLTAAWLSGRRTMPAPPEARRRAGVEVGIRGATAHNLKGVDLVVRTGELTALAGVSGSGKSTLAHDVLYLALARALGRAEGTPGEHTRVLGASRIADVVLVDQAGRGATSRANPATYVGAWDQVRALFAALPAAKEAGLSMGSFSFNVAGAGRCEVCQGEGVERIEMQFLSDIEIACEACAGTRFRALVRDIKHRGHAVSDLLELSVEAAVAWLEADEAPHAKRAAARLRPVVDVGLGYVRLGHRLSTLSSGEWQRLRLAQALGERPGEQPTLYVFDEPTTGLHFEDVAVLLHALRQLTARGHGVLVVEHHPEFLAAVDRIVELGPEGGHAGGRLVADGTPQALARGATPTAAPLREALGQARRTPKRTRTSRIPASTAIEVRGARHHNLKQVSLDVPRDRFVVVSGPSGSGKSSLAFDVIFAEGQRRYIETLGSYARQFVGGLGRPDVDHVSGIPPTVAIEQRRTRGGRRSTVATVTEISHHLRLLFARAGEARCPTCARPLASQHLDELVDQLWQSGGGREVAVLAPRIWGRKGYHRDVLDAMARRGVEQAWIDGQVVQVLPMPSLDRYREHDVAEVVGTHRLGGRSRRAREAFASALEAAWQRGQGTLGMLDAGEAPRWYARERTCPEHGFAVPEMDPRLFSHNSKRGWCPACRGLGTQAEVDVDRLTVHSGKTLSGGALPALAIDFSMRRVFLREARDKLGVSTRTAWKRLKAADHRRLLRGDASSAFVGAGERVMRVLRTEKGAGWIDRLGDAIRRAPCEVCAGTRLRPEARAVVVGGHTLPELLGRPVASLAEDLAALDGTARTLAIARPLLVELRERITLLERLGLGYLGLDRDATTLSGGEAQRLRIAAQLGSPLRGVLYVLDEPTIGLHARDNARLIEALRGLHARGNGLLVVEHDLDTIRQADQVIDLGPGGGRHGGHIVAQATPAKLQRDAASPTGRLLARPAPRLRHAREVPRAAAHLTLENAQANNLRNVTVAWPLGQLTAVTGVSGAGKSSLVHGALVPTLRHALQGVSLAGATRVIGSETLTRVIEVDATPIGKTPRSVPATYLGVWDVLRKLLAQTEEARARGYGPSRFSFNVVGGRCVACEGRGETTVEMSFLPNVRVPCERCEGGRFEAETLDIRWQELDVAALLRLTFEEAQERLVDIPHVSRALGLMCDVGLGYLTLGQASPTLSGGEAQRMRMVSELQRGGHDGATCYVLDEPTIGLHGEDVDRLLATLRRFVARGDTVVVIEHNLEFIAQCDHVIDVGPDAGAAGGRVVAQGAPATVARRKRSVTGAALAAMSACAAPGGVA